MTTDPQTRSRPALDAVALLARWFVGACFIYMGLIKALEPDAFLKLVREYDVVANPFPLNAIASLLPWFEIFCGMLLIAGVAVRGAALVLMAMLVPFTVLVLRRALEIAAAEHKPFCIIKFDCGCGNGEVLICTKLIENGGLILLSCWLLFARSRRFCLRFNLLKSDTGL